MTDSTSSDRVSTPPGVTSPDTDAEEGAPYAGDQAPVVRPGADTAPEAIGSPRTDVPSSRYPGRARFDIDTARARLGDPDVSPERLEESLRWAEDAVLDRIQQVAPDENPLGVVPRPEEVVELLAAEHLRAGHLPATALLDSLIQSPDLTARPAAQPQSWPAPPSEPAGMRSASGPVAASTAEIFAPGAPGFSPDFSSPAVTVPAEKDPQPSEPAEPVDVLLAPPARRAGLDPISDWLEISARGGSRRSSALRAIDQAVSDLPRDAGRRDLQRVLVKVTEWQGDKGPESGRWEAVSRLEAAVRDRLDQLAAPPPASSARVSVRDRVEQRASGRTPVRGGHSAQPGPSSRRNEPPVMAPLLSAASGAVEVEGFGPASGFEAEVHKYKVVLHPGAVAGEYGDIVTLPGLLTITLDTAGGVPILEIVTKPARGLVRGFADGRAERSEVLTAFNEVLSRLEHARPGARLAQIFPASAGYVVDYLAEDLPVRMNEAGGSTILVHHTATASVGHLVAFIQHVRGRMRQESEPVRLAHADAGVGFGFGAWAREDFIGWLSRRPEWDREANPWDSNDLEGALALGYTQVAATVRGGLNRAHRPKDFTAVASRDALAAIRKGLGAAPRAYLEHRAGRIAARFKDSFKDEIVVRGGGILDLPLTMSSGPLRATVGQYLDNLLLEKPERFVDQHESLGIRTHFHTLETNPDHRGVPRLDPPVVRMEVRAYASTRETPQTIADDSDTLALLSLSLYNQARLDRGLPPVGRPIAPAQHWPQYAPPTRPLPSSRPADSAMSAGPDPAEAPAPSSVPLAPALAETAARLIAMDAETRAQELASLAPWDREALAADPAFVEQLRMALSESDFRAVAGRLLVVVPEGVEQPVAARGKPRPWSRACSPIRRSRSRCSPGAVAWLSCLGTGR